METAPIAFFVYNRPEHTRRTVEALQGNEMAVESDLFIFSDGPKNAKSSGRVQEVRDYMKTIAGFKSINIVLRETNLGLADSIIDGVTKVCSEYGRVIVLEDDLVTSAFFLKFMNQALDTYEKDGRVGSIHGYWYPVDSPVPETFFLRGASCWGWATWSRAWQLFERDGTRLLAELRRQNLTNYFDLDGAIPYTWLLSEQIAGKNDSWAIRWHAATFLANRLQLSPGRSLVQNIGFDGSGIHTPVSKAYATKLASSSITVRHMEPEECLDARAALIRFYRRNKQGFLVRALRRLRQCTGL